MINKVPSGKIDLSQLDSELKANRSFLQGKANSVDDKGFLDLLKNGINEVNSAVKSSEKASMDLVSGKSSNMHEVMLAASQAELGFNLLVQLRNKAIEAYQEVMRMQV